MDNVYPGIGDKAIIDAVAGSGGTWNGAKIMLFQDDVTPGPGTVLADLTAATFTGYAISAAVVWGAGYQEPDNAWVTTGAGKQFLQTAITTTNTVYGWALVGDPSGTPFLIASQRFDTPISFTSVNRGVVVVPTLALKEDGTTPVYSYTSDLKILTYLVATGHYLDGVVMRLFKNDITPDGGTLLADFTVADFSGYGDSGAIGWGPAFLDVDGVAKVAGGSVQFTQTGTGTINTVYGWYLVGAPGGSEYLVASARFDTAISFTATSRGVVVEPVFALKE